MERLGGQEGIPLPQHCGVIILVRHLGRPLISNAFPDGVWAAFLKEAAIV